MSQVTLQIGGKPYPINCADGEEAHIAKLGAMIDEKYSQLGAARAPQEAQNMLFAALFLADELHGMRANAGEGAPPPLEDDTEAGKGGKKAELRAEIEQLRGELDNLRRTKKELREERDDLAKQLEQSRSARAPSQVDMFGDDVLATRLEELASRAENFAEAIEANGNGAAGA